MVQETIIGFSAAAKKKVSFMNNSIGRYLALSALAGVYVGLGIILIFSIGDPVAHAGGPGLKALMGASFGIALTLVIFAGSELYTGNNMVMTIGVLTKKITILNLLKLWVVCYVGNMIGALILSALAMQAGMFHGKEGAVPLIVQTAIVKGTSPFAVLLIKGFLCNVLVCLAVWTSARAKDDMAKIALIFWCLFGFIGSGYEHSIANMTVIGISAMISDSVTWGMFWHNLIPVTLGNTLSGVGFGLIYWYISNQDLQEISA